MPGEVPVPVVDKNYYKGSQEKAEISEVTKKKLELRAKLTQKSDRLVIVMVGLPGRGKSFMSRKLKSYFTWRGGKCEEFNVGKYRREFTAMKREQDLHEVNKRQSTIVQSSSSDGAASASFFDTKNADAKRLREEVAMFALRELLKWIELPSNGAERVGIFDATNSTKDRRDAVLRVISNEAKSNVGVVFLESVCDDVDLLEENFRQKVKHSPDFAGMTESEALNDLKERVKKYEAAYETIDDDDVSYIKVYNLSSKVLANQIYGRMSKSILPALMMWHVGNRPIWFCRAGQTVSEENRRKGMLNSMHSMSASSLSESSRFNRRDRLGTRGVEFRNALSKFVEEEGTRFVADNENQGTRFSNGTSTSVDSSFLDSLRGGIIAVEPNDSDSLSCSDEMPSFPCKVMCSTMPRSIETATWENLIFQVEQYSNLNPLDKGDFSGLEIEDIRDMHPEWYSQLEKNPYDTRFPGGESYKDLIYRLESCLIEMEQQVSPVLVVSHISVIQCLLAYFRNSPVHECTNIEVPLHTIIEMVPMKGAGWSERHICLVEPDPELIPYPLSSSDDEDIPSSPKTPIWGDHHLSRHMSGIVESTFFK